MHHNMLLTNTLYSIIRVVYDVQLTSGVTTSKVIWYHMHIGVGSRRMKESIVFGIKMIQL